MLLFKSTFPRITSDNSNSENKKILEAGYKKERNKDNSANKAIGKWGLAVETVKWWFKGPLRLRKFWFKTDQLVFKKLRQKGKVLSFQEGQEINYRGNILRTLKRQETVTNDFISPLKTIFHKIDENSQNYKQIYSMEMIRIDRHVCMQMHHLNPE